MTLNRALKNTLSVTKPWFCMSIVTQWRTYDFMFEKKEEAVHFHIAVESMIVVKESIPEELRMSSSFFKSAP
jgi:hypothetical protein